MAAVFPESMDKLNLDDSRGSLATVENYIRYMAERMEFSMRNTTRAVSGATVTSPQVVVLLESLNNTLSALSSEVNQIKGQITALENRVEALEKE